MSENTTIYRRFDGGGASESRLYGEALLARIRELAPDHSAVEIGEATGWERGSIAQLAWMMRISTNGQRGPKPDPDRDARVKRLAEQGHPVSEISRTVGVCRGTVEKTGKRLGITFVKGKRGPKPRGLR